MHQATRVRFRGGDPLALTKRIQARREANAELDRVFGGEEGISPIRFQAEPDEHITSLRLLGLVLFFLVLEVVIGGFVWIVMAGAA